MDIMILFFHSCIIDDIKHKGGHFRCLKKELKYNLCDTVINSEKFSIYIDWNILHVIRQNTK